MVVPWCDGGVTPNKNGGVGIRFVIDLLSLNSRPCLKVGSSREFSRSSFGTKMVDSIKFTCISKGILRTLKNVRRIYLPTLPFLNCQVLNPPKSWRKLLFSPSPHVFPERFCDVAMEICNNSPGPLVLPELLVVQQSVGSTSWNITEKIQLSTGAIWWDCWTINSTSRQRFLAQKSS